MDLFDYQLNLIRKEFKEILEKEVYEREKTFIKLVAKMEMFTKKELQQKVNEFIQLPTSFESSENDIVDYNEWLQSKL
jgi:hypothetical protein